MRVENIELMLEKLFGPEGQFAQNNNRPISDVANYIIQAIKYAKQRGLNNVDSEISSGNVSKLYTYIYNIFQVKLLLFQF